MATGIVQRPKHNRQKPAIIGNGATPELEAGGWRRPLSPTQMLWSNAVVKCWGRIVLSAQAISKRLSDHKGGVNSGDALRWWGVNGRLMAQGAIAAGKNGSRLHQLRGLGIMAVSVRVAYPAKRYAYEVRPLITSEGLTMAGVASRLSRKELEFMAGNIGPELVPFLNPEDVVKGMNDEKQQRLLAMFSVEDRLAGISIEEFLQGISPKDRKKLFELVLKTVAADLTDDPEGDAT